MCHYRAYQLYENQNSLTSFELNWFFHLAFYIPKRLNQRSL